MIGEKFDAIIPGIDLSLQEIEDSIKNLEKNLKSHILGAEVLLIQIKYATESVIDERE